MLRAALVTPLSGPLGEYGRAGAVALELWAQWCRGGARLTVHDAHPDPGTAAAAAERERPDVLFGPYGSGPARAVVAATSRLVFNHGGARVGPAPNLVDVLAPAETYFDGAVAAVSAADPGVRTVRIAHARTGFAEMVAAGAVAAARRAGLDVSATALPETPPDGDLLLVAGAFEDERDAAHALLPGPWRAAGFVGAGVEEVLADLGELREGLLGPAQWLAEAAPEPDEGP